jgi:hypothetical protein
MSPVDRLRWAVAPVQSRSMSLVLGGVVVFGISGVAATLIDLPRVIDALLALVMFAAWFVGICGMIGYFRWFFNPKSYNPDGTGSTRPKD